MIREYEFQMIANEDDRIRREAETWLKYIVDRPPVPRDFQTETQLEFVRHKGPRVNLYERRAAPDAEQRMIQRRNARYRAKRAAASAETPPAPDTTPPSPPGTERK